MTASPILRDEYVPRQLRSTADGQALLRTLNSIVASSEPAVVFTSLIRLLVPLVCDEAHLTISGPDSLAYSLHWPLSDDRAEAGSLAPVDVLMTDQQLTENSVHTPLSRPGTPPDADYHGVLTLTFAHDRPDARHGLIALLITERANMIIETERLRERAQLHQTRAANLDIALASNRRIGAAIGILMTRHRITEERAFELLRQVSQYSHRKLNEVAADVIERGELELPTGMQQHRG